MAMNVIPVRYRLRLKQRLAVVTYAEEHGVKPAARHFGIDRKTVREWRNRWRAAGERGLINCGIWVSTEAHAPAASFGL
jgi:transposase-like protein